MKIALEDTSSLPSQYSFPPSPSHILSKTSIIRLLGSNVAKLNFDVIIIIHFYYGIVMETQQQQSPTEPVSQEQNDSSKPVEKKKVVRHRRSSTKVLRDWLAEHLEYPYPNDAEKEVLAERTGLTIRQISYWFVNARRRKHSRRGSKEGDAGTTAATDTQQDMTPLDRWRHSPPDQEPVSWEAIANAIESSSPHVGSEAGISHPGLRSCDVNQGAWLFESEASLGSSNGSWPSDSSAHSFSSGSNSLSGLSCRSKGPRRRRKFHGQNNKLGTTRGSAGNTERLYQCTFCTDTFKTRYDWTRHESTLHLVLENWTCLPFGPLYSPPSEGARCALCDELNPSDAHLESHHVRSCTVKPTSARSFFRKDHLRQHLRLAHNINNIIPSMQGWKSKITRIKSRCGFCGDTFELWSDRNDHLTDHFRAGARMKDWKGCRVWHY